MSRTMKTVGRSGGFDSMLVEEDWIMVRPPDEPAIAVFSEAQAASLGPAADVPFVSAGTLL